MKHIDSGLRCLVGHYEGDWRNPVILPPCIKCSNCHEWLQPEEFANGECLPTQRAPDLPKAGVKSEVDEMIDRGVCPSCTWRGDTELENGVCPQCGTDWLALQRQSASG